MIYWTGALERNIFCVKDKTYNQIVDIIFLCSVGRRFMGRRGAILIEMTGGQKNSAIGFGIVFWD